MQLWISSVTHTIKVTAMIVIPALSLIISPSIYRQGPKHPAQSAHSRQLTNVACSHHGKSGAKDQASVVWAEGGEPVVQQAKPVTPFSLTLNPATSCRYVHDYALYRESLSLLRFVICLPRASGYFGVPFKCNFFHVHKRTARVQNHKAFFCNFFSHVVNHNVLCCQCQAYFSIVIWRQAWILVVRVRACTDLPSSIMSAM